jgi:hypothetical protein
MVVSYEFLRGVLGMIGLACAYMAGRGLTQVRQGRQRPAYVLGWLIRAALCMGGIVFRHSVDSVAMAMWAAAVVAFAAAFMQGARRRTPHEP